MTRNRVLTVAALVVMTAAMNMACVSGIHARERNVGGLGGGTLPTSSGTALPNNLPRVNPDSKPESSRVCRGAVRSGFIAVDYVASQDCVKTSNRVYNTAVLAEYSRQEVGAHMYVCAGENVPDGWEFRPPQPREYLQCPREPTDPSSALTVVEMVRLR